MISKQVDTKKLFQKFLYFPYKEIRKTFFQWFDLHFKEGTLKKAQRDPLYLKFPDKFILAKIWQIAYKL